jgi:hypothetical protein
MSEARPPRGWLPVAAAWRDGTIQVHWSHFAEEPLREPFFDDSVHRILRKPFNRLFRYTTSVDRLQAWLHENPYLEPSGFIFHMSRCGSTLVSQMLGALPHSIAISEAPPIDAVADVRRLHPEVGEDEQVQWLRWMICAFGQQRRGDEQRFFVKLDAWHTLHLPLFRRAFPEVPWIFLYRDPVEVLVSQMRQPGLHMIPPLVAAERFGLTPPESWLEPATYRARVLAAISEPIVRDGVGDCGLLVNYRQLPDAVEPVILRHFDVASDEAERRAMAEVASRNAKSPAFAFVNDSAAKQVEATDALRALADVYLGAHYRRLEAMRQGETAPVF